MKLGAKVAIGVGVTGVVGAVLFGTPFSRGLLKNYWGAGTQASPEQSPVGATVPRAPPGHLSIKLKTPVERRR